MSFFNFGGSSKASSSLKSDFGTGTSNTQKEKEKENSLLGPAKINPADFAPKRFGLRYDPPTIILEYLIPSAGKLYHHKMQIYHLKSVIKNQELIENLRKKHAPYLPADKVSDQQLNSLLDKLKAKLGQSNAQESRPATISAATRAKSMEPTQKTDIFNLDTSSKTDSFTLGTSSYKPSNNEGNSRIGTNALVMPSFISDTAGKQGPIGSKQATFTSESTPQKFWNDESFSPIKNNSMTDSSKNKTSSLSNSNGFWDVEDEIDKDVDYSKTDLNKLSTEELEKHKKRMDVLFAKNQKKPGDPGFVYDVREEFHPHEKNEWDDDF